MPRRDPEATESEIHETERVSWDGCTDIQNAFLHHWGECAVQDRACKIVGVSKASIWRWRQSIEAFAVAFDATRRGPVVATLEDAAANRAMEADGERPPSDRLLEFLLKANAPERYREHHHHTGEVQFTRKTIVIHGQEAPE